MCLLMRAQIIFPTDVSPLLECTVKSTLVLPPEPARNDNVQCSARRPAATAVAAYIAVVRLRRASPEMTMYAAAAAVSECRR